MKREGVVVSEAVDLPTTTYGEMLPLGRARAEQEQMLW